MSSLMRNVIVCDEGKCEATVAGKNLETVTQLRSRAEAQLGWRTRVSVPADWCPEHAWRDPRPGEVWDLAVCGPLSSRGHYSRYQYQRWVFDGIWRYVPAGGGSAIMPDDKTIYDGRIGEAE